MIKTLVREREEKAHRSVLGGMALAVLVILALVPARASAATNASLGGGNALARATAGQSQGLTHANTASNLLARLTFASTRGGKPDEVPPPQEGGEGNTGGTEAEGTNGSEGAGVSNQNQGEGSGNNGGASAGNGGNGGPGTTSSQGSDGYGAGDGGNGGGAAPGGSVRAGNVVSNANALNMLNVNIVRISSR